MKFVIVFAVALVAVAVAAPADKEVPQIVKYNFDPKPEGSYTFGYESQDGSARNEEGVAKEVLDEENKPRTVVVVRGSYSYVDPEGKQETITYYADEKGYHADGPSVPVVPSRR